METTADLLDAFNLDPLPTCDLRWIAVELAVILPDEHVIKFVLDEAAIEVGCPVQERADFTHVRRYTELFVQPSTTGGDDRLTGPRVAATAVRPDAAEVELCRRAALEQEPAALIEEEDREGAMQDTGSLVCRELRRRPYGLTHLVHHDYEVGRNLVGLDTARSPAWCHRIVDLGEPARTILKRRLFSHGIQARVASR